MSHIKSSWQVDPSNPWLVVGSALSGQSDLPEAPSTVEPESSGQDDSENKKSEEAGENVVPAGESEDEEESGSDDGEETSSDESEEDDGKDKKIDEENEEVGASKKGAGDLGSSGIVKNVPSLDQEMLVDMAFANDDVVAQFKEEKDKIVDEETEKVKL